MKKLYYLTALILALPFVVSAQSNYKPGYIVTSRGDTVKGYIDYQEWDANPSAINFRKAADGQSTKYGVDDISSFSVDKTDSYKRYTIAISNATIDPNKIDAGRDTSFHTATVFLRVLEQGNKMALYSYRDDIKVRYYIGDAPGYAPIELVYRLYIDPNWEYNVQKQGDRGKLVTENIFRKQLSGEALKNDEWKGNLIPLIARSEYIEDDLIKIVKKINHTTEATYAKTHYSGSQLNFFAGAALSIMTTTPDAGQSYAVGGGGPYTSFGPAVSLGINLFANPATQRLQFRLELSGAKNSYKSLYTLKVSPYKPTEASYDVQALSISPQVIYNFYNTENLKVFVGVGIVFSHYNYANSYFGTQNHDGSEADIATNNPFLFNTSDNSFIGKIGVQFAHHFLIYAAMQSKVSATVPNYFALTSDYRQIGINYLF